MAILLVSSGLALAQTNHGGMRSAGPTMRNNPMRNNPTPQPSNEATVGRGAGMNPSNSQDLSIRSNPQDLTRSGASNPESLTGR
jgi:hypothetical protein